MVGGRSNEDNLILDSTEWYDPKLNRWQFGPKMITPRYGGGLAVVKDNIVLYYMGAHNYKLSQFVHELDFSSEPSNWKPTTNMLVNREHLGVGVINNYIYAVGGFDIYRWPLKSAEVFDCRTQKWRMVSSMSTRRSVVGIGVLNNLLYAVGGFDGEQCLNSVECYHPGLDKWTSVSEMCARRSNAGVGVLDGVLYSVGGENLSECLKSVEAYKPSTGVWSSIPDMHLRRCGAGVAVLNGLLYVVGGWDGTSYLDSVEYYNPNTNTWTMITASMNVTRSLAGVVVIERPRHSKKRNQSGFSFLIEYIDIYSIISFCTIVSLLFFYLFSSF
ncbi:kelch-like protein 2 isoform X2 [Acyrthosiphon pisum]|uniref:Uncharacterized protein n=1 Tax=Acyrthosiphon pisum TaxID=7029 RepID=A0A8R2FCE5_ACYPI|nr:kelch-like protein 2 isoform X2 [Acyrthosiphon pisum]|eukprot:XP_008188229.1 PREDICTED: kelch-like protein 2 isoform X2 [Acyrthosiphon pisum]